MPVACAIWRSLPAASRGAEQFLKVGDDGVGAGAAKLLRGCMNPGQRKLENIRRDPRVAVSFEGDEIQPPGLRHYVVVHGRATIEEGGAPELLQELARGHLGPDVKFPPNRPASAYGSRSSGWAGSVPGPSDW